MLAVVMESYNKSEIEEREKLSLKIELEQVNLEERIR
jgi:hypothetical protein